MSAQPTPLLDSSILYKRNTEEAAILYKYYGSYLDARLRRVVAQYYGLDGYPPATYRYISEELGISKQRVAQLNRQAIWRMRNMHRITRTYHAAKPGFLTDLEQAERRSILAAVQAHRQQIQTIEGELDKLYNRLNEMDWAVGHREPITGAELEDLQRLDKILEEG